MLGRTWRMFRKGMVQAEVGRAVQRDQTQGQRKQRNRLRGDLTNGSAWTDCTADLTWTPVNRMMRR